MHVISEPRLLKHRCTSVSFLFLLLMGRDDKGISQEKGDMTQRQNVPQRLMCLDTWSPSRVGPLGMV